MSAFNLFRELIKKDPKLSTAHTTNFPANSLGREDLQLIARHVRHPFKSRCCFCPKILGRAGERERGKSLPLDNVLLSRRSTRAYMMHEGEKETCTRHVKVPWFGTMRALWGTNQALLSAYILCTAKGGTRRILASTGESGLSLFLPSSLFLPVTWQR